MPRRPRARQPKTVATLRHNEATRPNIPTAEYQPAMTDDEQRAIPVTYSRNTDLDPQLVWRGKDEQDQSDLVAHAPPLYIQEKVHPKVLIDDLVQRESQSRHSRASGNPDSPSPPVERGAGGEAPAPQYTQPDLFADFNGLPEDADSTEFYQHEGNWSNRLILGDSLQVMASLAEREGLRGQVQCIYLDPPYGIKFNSNFQWSTTSRDVRDGNAAHITREPEQVKAFRDTWRDGIHSYLSYLRDRLTVARDLLAESGSIFVQIGDENVHRVRALMDEVFGDENFVSQITFSKTSSATAENIATVNDFILWYARNKGSVKFRKLFVGKEYPLNDPKTKYSQVELADCRRLPISPEQKSGLSKLPDGSRIFRLSGIDSQTGTENTRFPITFEGQIFNPSGARGWSSSQEGMKRVMYAGRMKRSQRIINYVRFFDDNTHQ